MKDNHSNEETGHEKNVANLKVLIETCELFAERYNPVNPKITIPSLQEKHAQCYGILKDIDQKEAFYKDVVNKRQYDYEKLGPYCTSLYNAATVISEDPKLMEDIMTVIDKIRGEMPTPETDDNKEGQETEETPSTSQRSYDNLAAHFRKIITYLELIPGYVPNETELTIPIAKDFEQELLAHNGKVSKALAALQKPKRDRDHAMYNEVDGLYDRTQTVNKYVKSVFGATSPQFAQVSAIEFKDR